MGSLGSLAPWAQPPWVELFGHSPLAQPIGHSPLGTAPWAQPSWVEPFGHSPLGTAPWTQPLWHKFLGPAVPWAHPLGPSPVGTAPGPSPVGTAPGSSPKGRMSMCWCIYMPDAMGLGGYVDFMYICRCLCSVGTLCILCCVGQQNRRIHLSKRYMHSARSDKKTYHYRFQ